MTLEELQVLIDAQIGPYKKAMEDMKKETTKAMKDLEKSLSKPTEHINKQSSLIKSAFASIGKYFAVGLIIKKLFDVGKYSLHTALEVSAAMNQIKRVMGESTQSFLKWSKGNALAFNLSQADALKYGAVYSNLFSNFIKDTQQLSGYTVKMLQASAIVASATGRSMEDVLNRIRSGMLGNTEAIEDLGVNVNVAMLKSTKAFQELANGRSWEQLDFNTQQAIRMMGILEQVSTKFGNTIMHGPTTSLAYFTALMKNAALNIGNALLPVMQAIMPALNTFASILNKATGALATFMQLLFGKKVSASPMSTMANDVKGIGGGLDEASKGAGDLGKGLGGAGKQAKALKKELLGLMGFDEINLLNKDNSDAGGGSGGGGGSGVGGGGGIQLPKVSFDDALENEDDSKIKKFLENLLELLKPTIEALERLKQALQPLKQFVAQGLIDFYEFFLKPVGLWVLGEGLPRFIDIISKTLNNLDFPKINAALREFWQALTPFTINVGEGLLWFLDNVLSPLTSWTISEIVPLFIKGLAEVIEILNSVIEAFKPFAKWLFDNFLSPLAKWTGSIVKNVIEGIVDALESFSDWAKENKTTVETITSAISSFALSWGIVSIATKIYGVVTALWAFVASGSAATAIGAIFTGAISVLTSPITLAIAAIGGLIFIGYELWKNWDSIISYLSELWQNFSNWIGEICISTSQYFVSLWDGVEKIFSNLYGSVVKILTPIVGWFNNLWTEVKNTFNSVWNAIWTVTNLIITKIYTWISDKFNAIKEFIFTTWEGIKSSISEILNVIWQSIKTIFNGINNTITSIFNTVKNFISETWNSIKTTVSNLVTEIWNTIKTKVTDIYNSVSEWFGKIPDKISEIWGKAISYLKGINLYQIGKDIIWGLINGIGSMASAVWEKAKSIAQGIGSAIKRTLGINSPSKVTTAFGRFVGQGLYLGIDKEESNVFDSARGLSSSVMKGLNSNDLSIDKNIELDVFTNFNNMMSTLSNILLGLKGDNSNKGDIIIQIGDTEFGRFAIDKINQEQERAGMTLLKI